MKYFCLFIVALIPVFTGCATHAHKRPIMNHQGELVGFEETKWKFFAVDSKAAKVSVETKDLNYSRKVNASEAEILADEELIKRISDGIASGITNAIFRK